ncbi:hypothetical protein SMD44_07944 [Streptomyces alboflavus]|uniref:Uncharacterized protein n=1 Tax=Streptomyces alboflavus TaxID=67267 RepID=A0A1Z1WPV7_9ACTN|nr:hypothetical protein SMD44_07944 [Streptomyces alboflavus]
MLGTATARKKTWVTTKAPRPSHITRRGPHRSESAADSHPATAPVTPYTVNTIATCDDGMPRSSRYGERKPASMPTPVMKTSRPR